MRQLKDAINIDQFFKQLRHAPSPILFLDYDGTLAPFVAKRDEAFPYEGILERIGSLMKHTRTRVVMISGRAVNDLIPILGADPSPEIYGGHGWEHYLPNGNIENLNLPDGVQEILNKAIDSIEQASCDDHSESKHASVTIHERSMTADQAYHSMPPIEAYWIQLASESQNVELHRFDGGLELRAIGRNKGHAVEDVLKQYRDGVMAAYLGDDNTDEDAFEKMGFHLKVLVRQEFRATQADYWITPPKELLEFLDRWIEATTKD